MVIEGDSEESANVWQLRGEYTPGLPRQPHAAFEPDFGRLQTAPRTAILQNATVEAGVVSREKTCPHKHVAKSLPDFAERRLVLDIKPRNAVQIGELEVTPRRADQAHLAADNLPIFDSYQCHRACTFRPAVGSFEIDGHKRRPDLVISH